MPDDRDQESFTDPDSRIMKHAGGGSEQSYNGYTAVDAEHQIIVAAELTNCAADSQALLGMLAAVQANTGEMPAQTLADAGFRSEAVLAKVADHHGDVIVALGREGREDAKVNAKTHPHTAAIAAKLKTEQGDAAYRRRKSIVEAPNGWIKAVMGLRQFSMRAWTRCKPSGSSSAWR